MPLPLFRIDRDGAAHQIAWLCGPLIIRLLIVRRKHQQAARHREVSHAHAEIFAARRLLAT